MIMMIQVIIQVIIQMVIIQMVIMHGGIPLTLFSWPMASEWMQSSNVGLAAAFAMQKQNIHIPRNQALIFLLPSSAHESNDGMGWDGTGRDGTRQAVHG